jgi:hypothetical protein
VRLLTLAGAIAGWVDILIVIFYSPGDTPEQPRHGRGDAVRE